MPEQGDSAIMQNMDTHKKSFVIGIMFIIILLLIITLAYVGLKKLNPTGHPLSINPIATSTVATSSPDTVPEEWPTYVNNSFGYQVRYPSEVTLAKNISIPTEDGTKYITYPAGRPIQVKIEDNSTFENLPLSSSILVSPLYTSIKVVRKPNGYTTLNNYVNNFVDQTVEQGQNTASGLYASSTPTSINDVNGYKVVVTDGSVIQNRYENYFFEKGDNVYKLDVAYSGYAFENKDTDELTRVGISRQIITSFRFIE